MEQSGLCPQSRGVRGCWVRAESLQLTFPSASPAQRLGTFPSACELLVSPGCTGGTWHATATCLGLSPVTGSARQLQLCSWLCLGSSHLPVPQNPAFSLLATGRGECSPTFTASWPGKLVWFPGQPQLVWHGVGWHAVFSPATSSSPAWHDTAEESGVLSWWLGALSALCWALVCAGVYWCAECQTALVMGYKC